MLHYNTGVVVHDKRSNVEQIAEVVFLVDWMLTAKKQAHKLHQIVAKQEFIEAIEYQMKLEKENIDKLKLRVSKTSNIRLDTMIRDGNGTQLMREMVWNPNLVFYGLNIESCLSLNQGFKTFQLRLGAIMHFVKVTIFLHLILSF